jgi:hypothetical protein
VFSIFKNRFKLKNIAYLFIIILLFAFTGQTLGQTFKVKVQIKNHPGGKIVFGYIRGDNFFPVDSTMIIQSFGTIQFDFPENAHPGVYRLNLGKTAAAKVLNEAPQILDFIFDNENIVLNTDFKNPVENLTVIESKENMAWFEFLAKDQVIRSNIESIEQEINSYWQKDDTATVVKLATEYNQLQMERDNFVMEASENARGLFVSHMIKNLRVPLLDGYLTSDERKESFKKEFFRALDFNDPALLNTTIYTDNIFKYLVMYNRFDYNAEKRAAEYKKALDMIVPNIRQNDEVYRFLMDYLIHGFEVLRMEDIVTYIQDRYNYPQ